MKTQVVERDGSLYIMTPCLRGAEIRHLDNAKVLALLPALEAYHTDEAGCVDESYAEALEYLLGVKFI